MERVTKAKARRCARNDMRELLNELLSENNETHEQLRIKLSLSKGSTKNFKQGNLYNLAMFYKIAMMYGKKVKISFE